jgi:hypothetical protein
MALSTFEKYEQYWHILHNSQEMIRFPEVKAGLVISVYGILFSVMLNSSTWIRESMDGWPVVVFVIIGFFVTATLISLYFAFKCFRPRFENKNPTSIIYFGDIVSDFKEYMAYHSFLEKTVIDDVEMSVQLAEQIHTNSSIARRKFQAVSKAIKVLFVSVFLLILLVAVIVIV